MSKHKKSKPLTKSDVRTFMRMLGYAKPYTARLIVGAVCSIVGGGSIIAMFIAAQSLLGYIFDNRALLHPEEQEQIAQEIEAQEAAREIAAAADLGGAGAAVPAADDDGNGLSKALMKKIVPDKMMRRLEKVGVPGMLSICGVFILIIILNSLAAFISIYQLQWVGQRIVMDLRVKTFAHLQQLSMNFYASSKVGDMISRTVADTQMLQTTITHIVTDIIRQPITFITMICYIVIVEWQLAIFSIILVPTVVLPIVFIGKRIRRLSREGQARLAEITSVMKEALDGVAVVKAFGQEKREEKRFYEQCHSFFRRMVSIAKARALNDPITHILGGIGGVGILMYAMIMRTPIEECIMFAAALWMLYEPLKKMGRINNEVQQCSASGDRIFEIIDAPITVCDAPDARKLDGKLESIKFENVSFNYGDKEVFKGMNLAIKSGESLAVVGPSGGGKTTLVSLLLRFFDPTSGAITCNGTDIRKFTIESLRGSIGLVLQDTFLFNDTIANNISYGKPDATRDEIIAAAKLAHAHEFIMEKENGYDTIVGERGIALSGGQKQRLAIARALIRHPSVLVLDEATSALDTESERYVQTAIDDLMSRLTVIVIAHRLSTIAKCDKIAVIGNGGVIEYGTHKELYERNGVYRELHDLQFLPRG